MFTLFEAGMFLKCSYIRIVFSLNVLFLYLLEKHYEARLVLNLFLSFGVFEARCSYKIVLIKKSVVINLLLSVLLFQIYSVGERERISEDG